MAGGVEIGTGAVDGGVDFEGGAVDGGLGAAGQDVAFFVHEDEVRDADLGEVC